MNPLFERFVVICVFFLVTGCIDMGTTFKSLAPATENKTANELGGDENDKVGEGDKAQLPDGVDSPSPIQSVIPPGTIRYVGWTAFQRQNAIKRLYKALFNRDPDSGALAYLDKELSEGGHERFKDHARNGATSGEYMQATKSKKTSAQILAQMYEGFLGPNRGVDPSGSESYLPRIADNSDSWVAGELAGSDEFLYHVYEIPNLNQELAQLMLKKAYNSMLFREPGDDGYSAHTNTILNRNFFGWREVIGNIVSSEEFKNVRSTKTPETLLASLYEGMLGRPVDSSGEEAWLPRIREGKYEEVALEFANSDEFYARLYADIVPPPAPEPVRKRGGKVRKCGKAICDDFGEFNALGATLMWGVSGYKFYREKLERNLQVLKDNNYDYIRVLGVVGVQPWWRGKEADMRWSDYDQVIAGLTDLAYDKYGLRVEWTLIGDGQVMVPAKTDKYRLIDKFIGMSRGREHKIMHFEVANESWQNGFPIDQEGRAVLRELTRYMRDRTDILVAASTAPPESETTWCDDVYKIYGGDVADIVTSHYNRDIRQDGFWQHVEASTKTCGNTHVSNNEPMGPGSSVEQEHSPLRLATAAAVSYITGNQFYVWHSEAGVWGGNVTKEAGKSDIYEYPSLTAFHGLRKTIPEDVGTYTRQDSAGNSASPLAVYSDGQKERLWSPGRANGALKVYGAVKGNNFIMIPLGIHQFVKMQARFSVKFDVVNPLTGEVIQHVELNPGESFDLRGLEAFIIKGTSSTSLDAACMSTTNTDGRGTPLPEPPSMRDVVMRVHDANPNLILQSCDNHDFMFAVLRELRKTDPRWGVNWKRGVVGDLSNDVVDYAYGPGPFENSPIYIYDIITGHCGPNPTPSWLKIDQRDFGWTLQPAPNKCR